MYIETEKLEELKSPSAINVIIYGFAGNKARKLPIKLLKLILRSFKVHTYLCIVVFTVQIHFVHASKFVYFTIPPPKKF